MRLPMIPNARCRVMASARKRRVKPSGPGQDLPRADGRRGFGARGRAGPRRAGSPRSLPGPRDASPRAARPRGGNRSSRRPRGERRRPVTSRSQRPWAKRCRSRETGPAGEDLRQGEIVMGEGGDAEDAIAGEHRGRALARMDADEERRRGIRDRGHRRRGEAGEPRGPSVVTQWTAPARRLMPSRKRWPSGGAEVSPRGPSAQVWGTIVIPAYMVKGRPGTNRAARGTREAARPGSCPWADRAPASAIRRAGRPANLRKIAGRGDRRKNRRLGCPGWPSKFSCSSSSTG